MSKKYPKAFPCWETASETLKGEEYPRAIAHPGMSLRDWFAGQALPNVVEQEGGDAENIANQCYLIAEEMIKRSKK